MQGNCNPDWGKETSTEEQGAAQAECKRWNLSSFILWNTPSVLTYPCMGLYHMKHWITSMRSPEGTDAHVQKDPSSLIKCITATGTLTKHSSWVTVPPPSPLASIPANSNGIKPLTLSASSTLDFTCVTSVPSFFELSFPLRYFRLMPFLSASHFCQTSCLFPLSLRRPEPFVTLPPVSNPFPALLI